MPELRDNPYSNFNFIVSLGGDQGTGDLGATVGGFSDVSGLGMEVKYAEYRNGNEKVSTVRKIPGTHTNDDVTFKRGLIGSDDLKAWLNTARDGTADARTVTVSLLDEARETVATWTLRRAQPKKWTGPTLGGKGGGDVAMEELVLVHEGIEYT
ncbi:phage tail protein [Kribbella sp. NPDC051952]|uniref:phage tail protein n=1 Tax=Kribbella sp. NPDC051952 TaxID=3154851 RepID=UPI00342D27A5